MLLPYRLFYVKNVMILIFIAGDMWIFGLVITVMAFFVLVLFSLCSTVGALKILFAM